jgi:glucose-1-phosphate cytidylyltransferase
LATNKGARVRQAAQRGAAERFMVTYGDGIGDVDIGGLLAFHRKHGRLATVTGYQPLSQYGMLDVNSEGLVQEMREKPRLPQWINAGFMVFESAALGYFGSDSAVDLEKDVLPRLVADGQLMMYRHTGFWASMDTFKDAQVLSDAWEAGAPWKLWAD